MPGGITSMLLVVLSLMLMETNPRRPQLCQSPNASSSANLHYVWSACQGTQSILSHDEIRAFLKKNSHHKDGKDVDDPLNGSGNINDLYQYLEQSASHCVSLLACIVPEAHISS
jgi:hypothetical protein